MGNITGAVDIEVFDEKYTMQFGAASKFAFCGPDSCSTHDECEIISNRCVDKLKIIEDYPFDGINSLSRSSKFLTGFQTDLGATTTPDFVLSANSGELQLSD